MSFSTLFTKLSDVEEQKSRHRNGINLAQGESRKRKLQKAEPLSNLKRQCLRSWAVGRTDVTPEEESAASEPHRHGTRMSKGARLSESRGWGYNQKNRPFRSNDYNKDGQNKAKNQKKKKQENSKRYNNYNKDGKRNRADFAQPRKRFMTQEFKDQHVIEAEGRLLCKYFILGRCTKGEECQLEHIEGYNGLIKAACKFYIQGACHNGATCPYMHKSFPCKFFHMYGNCRSDACRFSHDPLTDFTRKLLDDALQRENELAELNRKTEDPVSQTVNEEQNMDADIVIPVVRPSFYQSSETAVEDEALVSRNELQSDVTEEDSAPQTASNPESEDPLPSAAPVCYSVEAILGPRLFKPVLYTATQSQKSAQAQPKTTERFLNPVNAPYSVANVLRSQSFRETMNDKYKVSHLDNIHFQSSHGNSFKKPPYFNFTATSEHHSEAHSDTKISCEAKKTREGTSVAPNLTRVVDQITTDCERTHLPPVGSASQKCQMPKEPSADRPMSFPKNDKSVCSLPTKQSTTIKQNLKETTSVMSVADTRQDGPCGASLPVPLDNSESTFTQIFTNLNPGSNRASKASCDFSDTSKVNKANSCSRMVQQATKPSSFATTENKDTNNVSCNASFPATTNKREDTASAQTPGKSFQSLFSSLSSDADRTLTDTNSDKQTGSSGKQLEKPVHESQKAQFMKNTIEIIEDSGSSNNSERGFVNASPKTSNNNSQKRASTSATANSKEAKMPSKSFQCLFASLTPELQRTSSVGAKIIQKPAVTRAQNIEKSKPVDCGFNQATKFPVCTTESDAGFVGASTETTESTNNSREKSVSSSANKRDNTEKDKTSAKSFQDLFASPLNQSTVINKSKSSVSPQNIDDTRSQSKGTSSEMTVNEVTEESTSEHEKETAAISSSNVSSQSPQLQPQSGPLTSVFKTLFLQLRPYEQHLGSKTDTMSAVNVKQKKWK